MKGYKTNSGSTGERTRTSTSFRSLAPKASASTISPPRPMKLPIVYQYNWLKYSLIRLIFRSSNSIIGLHFYLEVGNEFFKYRKSYAN